MEEDIKNVQKLVKSKILLSSKSKNDGLEIGSQQKQGESSSVKNVILKTNVSDEIKQTSLLSKNNITKKIQIENTFSESSSSTQAKKSDKISVFENSKPQGFFNLARCEIRSILPVSVLEARPLVMAIHLVPSLPIGLFEILSETLEAATGKPVVLLYESRNNRPVAKEVVDIAILPAAGDWKDGVLLPTTFVFEHRLNKEFSPQIYADVVVATDRAPYVETLLDLRGCRCVLPDRSNFVEATNILFNHLKSKGEGPSFFGSNLDVNSQLAALHMIASKQVEVGILESPVIKYHRNYLPGMERLSILTSLGPLAPYRIMVHKDMPETLVKKISSYLLKIKDDRTWMEKFSSYSVLGFGQNSMSFYNFEEIKSVATNGPYY
ncbi:uncharacterized protein LOC122503090 [Leptopilina heterotoma]|uniref:uncharacterized protein LOC122503090 n=1 Tax=Leptopilina heterotoma TaxID=63436 RepID=UPI001CAA2A25|nr:uncharacterized protein LOC122503090 [Leptopilina heterotoma]XP_043469451.1 uncharacterized protein LOC122503090 [Leptopilina heterotoma]